MISERLYRALLWIYPKEHRREYGELMVQLFRDRMRHDGRGFGGLIVWAQMIRDLFVSALEEHRRGGDMKKRMWIAMVSLAALLVMAVGVGAILSQSNDEFDNSEINMRVFVWDGSNIHSFEGKDEIADFLQQEVEEDVTIWGSEDGITVSADESGEIMTFGFWELPAAYTIFPKDGESEIYVAVWLDSDPFHPRVEGVNEHLMATEGFAVDLRKAVEDGDMTQEEADRLLASERRWNNIMLEEWK